MKREAAKNYSDGTPVTAPLYICTCPAGHRYWTVTRCDRCVCGAKLTSCAPTDKKRTTSL